jgi:outer membrane protein
MQKPIYVAGCLTALLLIRPAFAQLPTPKEIEAANTLRLTLDEVKQRVLSDNKLLQMAALNVHSKGNAARAMRSSYFPQVIGQSIFMHFNDNLGTVLSTPGRTVTGPLLGRPLAMIPATTVDVPVVNQNTSLNMVMVAQPLTDVLKVRQGVKIARADEQIAQAQLDKGMRELLTGVEQIYWGMLVAQKIRAAGVAALDGIEPLARKGILEARMGLVEARQALHEVNNQLADLEEQMALLLDVPAGTRFDLAEPPPPTMPVRSAEEAVALALAHSPEIREADQVLCKARAAVAAGKLDYMPSIAIVGGYVNQSLADYIQPNIGFVGVVGSYTFVDWGKRRFTIRERSDMAAMANLKIQQTQDEVRQKATKAFRDVQQRQLALALAAELVEVRKEWTKAAKTPQAMFQAAKDTLTAQVDYLKADLNHRIAITNLTSLIGPQ